MATRTWRVLLLVGLLGGLAGLPRGHAQSKPEPLAFEVASIKPAAPAREGKFLMGFGNRPGRIDYKLVTVRDLLQRAYGVRRQQVAGPDWIDSDRFDISAKLPEGATSDQVPVMLQNLLNERFQLTLRREKKEMPVYALVVGKNGAKLEKAVGDASQAGPKKGIMITDGKTPGYAHMEGTYATISSLIGMLSNMVDRPVLDETGLEGMYNFTLDFSAESMFAMKRQMVGVPPEAAVKMEGGPAPESAPSSSIFSDIQKLGLRLEGRKAPLDLIVVEKGNRLPTEN